jgi:hypothetical protein
MTLTISKCISHSLLVHSQWYATTYHLVLTLLSPPKRNPVCIKQSFLIPITHSPKPRNYQSGICVYRLPLLDVSHKWSLTICRLLCLVSFTSHSFFKVPLCGSLWLHTVSITILTSFPASFRYTKVSSTYDPWFVWLYTVSLDPWITWFPLHLLGQYWVFKSQPWKCSTTWTMPPAFLLWLFFQIGSCIYVQGGLDVHPPTHTFHVAEMTLV